MTTIGPSLLITGEVTSQEDMTVQGTIKGQINLERGVLRVAEAGRVYAEVRGPSVTVDGTLDGSVMSVTRVELTSRANVSGTLTAPSIVMHDGAVFNGLIDMERQARAKNPAGLKIAVPAKAQAGTSETPQSAPGEERAWGT